MGNGRLDQVPHELHDQRVERGSMILIDLVQPGTYPSHVVRLPQVLTSVVLSVVPDLSQVFELYFDPVAEFPQGIRQPRDL